MANLLVLGTQWGDEGKGKIVDLLTPAFDVVARYQGGHNAGHTVWVGGRKIVLHLIPSGILHAGTLCVIGNGLVVAPAAFFKEIADLEAQGVAAGPDRVAVSRAAHLIMPWHPLAERVSEDRRGEKKIGTTCRGIGPAYEDKAARLGVRAGDLADLGVLREKIDAAVAAKEPLFRAFGLPPLDAATRIWAYVAIAGEQGAQAMASVAQGALLLRICDRQNSVTQFALLSSLFAVGRWSAGIPSGFIAEWLGFPLFFTLCATVVAVPGFVFLQRVAPFGQREVPAAPASPG
jgi:adenylosuccinate synthase